MVTDGLNRDRIEPLHVFFKGATMLPMNLTKIGVLLKNAFPVFWIEGYFHRLGQVLYKLVVIPGISARRSRNRSPTISSSDHHTRQMEESPVVTAITRLIELKWPSWRTCRRYHHASRLVFLETSLGEQKCAYTVCTAACGCWRGEYILSWFEKNGDKIHEGKWMGDLRHIVELFSDFWSKAKTQANLG